MKRLQEKLIYTTLNGKIELWWWLFDQYSLCAVCNHKTKAFRVIKYQSQVKVYYCAVCSSDIENAIAIADRKMQLEVYK